MFRFVRSKQEKKLSKKIRASLFGLAVGDALGLALAQVSRKTLVDNPVRDMQAFGTYNQAAGTWAEPSSLSFCLAEALTHEFNLHNIGLNFVYWFQENYWTARAKHFDIDEQTKLACLRIGHGLRPDLAGAVKDSENTNASLMRILPLVFYIKDKPINERFEITKQVSSITHAHIRSVVSCFYYLEFARYILEGFKIEEAYKILQEDFPSLLHRFNVPEAEIALFHRLLKNDISKLDVNEIHSDNYVIQSLEASIWCLMNTNKYSDAVLKAVNLGEDSNTTAAITGGLAGLVYGYRTIPKHWINQLARKENIEDLAKRMGKKLEETKVLT